MGEHIVVVGAGICGLCTSLALAGNGHKVTIYERDIPPPDGDADEAFFSWKRRGAAQFRHPHAFLAVMCNLLEQHYPDLVEQFWAAGARKVTFEEMLPPNLHAQHLKEQRLSGQNDQRDNKQDNKQYNKQGDLWLLMCRRATMETVLRRYVSQSPAISINNHANITGMVTDTTQDRPRVLGLRVQTNRGKVAEVAADIVVDASGRTTKFPGWLKNLGATVKIEETDADIVYFTRHYRLNPGQQEPSRHSRNRPAGDLGYIKYGVFPGDNGHFSIILCLPNHETELRAAVKDGNRFNAICQAIPGLTPWIAADKSTPTTPPFGFGDIHSVWKHFIHDGKPVALNFFAVGDSAVRTNPLYGRGCSTGIIHAHLLADVLSAQHDPTQRALAFDQRTEQELRPIFNASLREDKSGIRRARAILAGKTLDEARSLKQWLQLSFRDAMAAAAREQLHVMRGAMRSFNLMEKPGDFLKDNRTRLILARYLLRGRRKNAQRRFVQGPKRDDMLAMLSAQQQGKPPPHQ